MACEHMRWMRFHYYYNWEWGPKKDFIKRTHPCLKPFEELPREEQLKDLSNVTLAIKDKTFYVKIAKET